MFGLMTVARHELAMANLLTSYDALNVARTREVEAAQKEAEGWRFLATKLAADIADFQRRTLPPVLPDDLTPEVGSVNDEDAEWTPSAVAKREKVAK